MKFAKGIKIFFIVFFASVLMTVAVMLCIVERNTEYLEDEKRMPASRPVFSWTSLRNGDYTEQLRIYYSDTLPYRSTIKRFSDRILSYKGISIDEIYIDIPNILPTFGNEELDATPIPEDVTLSPDDSTTRPEGVTATPTKAPEEGKPNVNDFYENQGIVTYQKRAMELYWGSKAKMQVYANALNKLQVNRPDIQVWSMNIPLSSAFYLPESLASKYGDQKADGDYIKSLLNNQIEFVDVYRVLEKHKNEDIYLRTDHHWSYLGAYYAVEAMMQQTGLKVPSLSNDYTTKTENDILGSFYLYFDQKHLVKWPETFKWYEPKFSFTGEYYDYSTMKVVKNAKNQMFFYYSKPFYDMVNYGDSYLAHITTTNKTGRRIAVFKDSFGNAIAPFLAAGYDEIWVIDIRYYQGDVYAFLDEHEITDVLMASCMFTNAGNKASYFKTLFDR